MLLLQVMFAKNIEDLKDKKNRWKWGKRILIFASWAMFGLLGAAVAYFSSKYLAKKFGTITLEQMLSITQKLQNGGYIKRNKDGIETIKESKLYEFNGE